MKNKKVTLENGITGKVVGYLSNEEYILAYGKVCGNFTHGKKKPCKNCKHFILWGTSTGYCDKHKKNKMCPEHCKYFKRNAEIWSKDGKCKVNEAELYC